jgi:hypothetical protein
MMRGRRKERLAFAAPHSLRGDERPSRFGENSVTADLL